MNPTEDSTNNINNDCPAYFEGRTCHMGSSCNFRHSEAALQTLGVCQVWEWGDVCPLWSACPYRHEDHDVVIHQSLVRMRRLTNMVTDENTESGPTPVLPVPVGEGQVDDDDWDDGPNEEDPAYPGPVPLDEDWDEDSNEGGPVDVSNEQIDDDWDSGPNEVPEVAVAVDVPNEQGQIVDDDDDWDDGPNVVVDDEWGGPNPNNDWNDGPNDQVDDVDVEDDWEDWDDDDGPNPHVSLLLAQVVADAMNEEWERRRRRYLVDWGSSDSDDDEAFEWSVRNDPTPSTSTSQGQPSSTAGQSQRPNHNGDLNRRRVKTSDCKFFFSTGGTCRKGDACTFRHNTSALGSSVICEDWHGRRSCPLNDVCNKRHATRREVEVTNAEMNLNSTRTTRETSNSAVHSHSTVDTSSSSDAQAGPSGVNDDGTNIAGSGSGNDLNLNARRIESTVDSSNNDTEAAEASVGAAGGGSNSTSTVHSHVHNHRHRNQNDCRDFIYRECPRGDACLLRHSEYLKAHRSEDIGICSDWRSPRGCSCNINCRMRHYIPYDQFKLSKEQKKKSSGSTAAPSGSDTAAAGEPGDQNPADDDKIECKICYMEFQEIKRRGDRIVSLDCGHMVCEKCCRSIMRSQPDPRCPYCRLRIRNPRPLYLN